MTVKEADRYDRGLWPLERIGLGRLRRFLLEQVSGEVLEIGVGTGVNLPLYLTDGRTSGIDVSMARLAGAARRSSRRPFDLACADARNLPFNANRFDAVVSTLVFCSLPDPALALSEIRRVLTPNGRLYMLEHVRGQGIISRRITDCLHPVWYALQGECHLNRETAALVENGGFDIVHSSRHGWSVIQLIIAQPGQAHYSRLT